MNKLFAGIVLLFVGVSCTEEAAQSPDVPTLAPVSGPDASNPGAQVDTSEDVQASDSASSLPAGQLRVLTYNVHGLPSIITGDDTLTRLREIAPLLNDYDLVGVQEDFQVEGHEILTAGATHPHRWWFDATYRDHVYGSVLSVFSQLPEQEHYFEHYRDCNGLLDGSSDCLASKGFQVIRLVLAEGVTLDVYNSHLEAGGGDEDNAARAGHVEQLKAAMQGYSKGRALIFLGDTNLHGGDPADDPLLFDWMEFAELRDACDEVSCSEPGRIDRIFVRDSEQISLTVEEWSVEEQFFDAEGVPLSDHDAIAARIGWRLN